MNPLRTIRRAPSFLLALVLLLPLAARALSVDHATVNGRVNPLGIGSDDISFSWATTDSGRARVQTAYELRVGTHPGADDTWRSGRVTSDRQIDISLPSDVRLQPATRYYWQVRVWDGSGQAGDWSAASWFETGLLSEADWKGAEWIAAAQPPTSEGRAEDAAPLLRGLLSLRAKVKSARLYASAHGVYQVTVNGQRAGDQHLAPGWTDYHQRIQAQTYDVTALLQEGRNAIGAALGDGWYRGKVGIGWRRVYGDRLAFIAQLRVVYTDGTSETFGTDASWTTAAGPYVQTDLQDGEVYDARREQPGWDRPDFDGTHWARVAIVASASARLVPQPDEPVRATHVLTARNRTSVVAGEYIYDLGQNMVGVPRLTLTGKSGQTVRLRFAEELHRIGDSRGRLYTENLRAAKATDTYTFAKDGTVVYQPTFTQHGFRYIEITGVDVPPEPSDVHGVVLGSDLRDTGDLRLSHPMLDQLVRNIRWGQRGNFLSIPTDTPARDERLGWTGDINVFVPTAARFQDTRAFLTKWMDDLRDAQRSDGNIPAIVPYPGRDFAETGVGWSDAFITVPHAVWRASGDLRIVRRNWAAIQRFYRFVHESATRDGNLLEEGRSSWFSGDWLNLESVDRLEEHKVIATAYFAENTRMMAEMAAAMGHADQANAWRDLVPKIRAAFCAAYRKSDGTIYTGTQTVYAMALGMDLIADPTERAKTAEQFVAKLAADRYHLRTGFLGTPWLLPALTSIGREDLAMRLLLNDDYPSWGFEVRMGATTMWERWNSIHPNGEFGDVEMNSFNHYAYGAVGEWMFGHLGGVQAIEPGYKRFRVAPIIDGSLDHSRCELQTPYGLISSSWTLSGNELTLAVTVPVNTRAEVVLPAPRLEDVSESGKPVVGTAVLEAVHKPDRVHITIGSGRYEFVVRRAGK